VKESIPSENHLETSGILWQATFLKDWKLAAAKNFHMEFHLHLESRSVEDRSMLNPAIEESYYYQYKCTKTLAFQNKQNKFM